MKEMEFWMQTMDVNLRRLADKIILILKFLVRLTIFMQHPHSTDGADILVKASGKTVYNQEKMYFRNAAILYPITYLPPSASEIHNHIVNFVLHKRAGLCNKNANITEETS